MVRGERCSCGFSSPAKSQASGQIEKVERTFFSRCTKQHHFSRDIVLFHDMFRGQGSGYRSNGDEIVTASMSDSRKSICKSS